MDYFIYLIGMGATFLGACVKTLRRWHAKGMITCYRTLGGHHRFSLNELFRILEERQDEQKEQNEKIPHSRAIYWHYFENLLSLW